MCCGQVDQEVGEVAAPIGLAWQCLVRHVANRSSPGLMALTVNVGVTIGRSLAEWPNGFSDRAAFSAPAAGHPCHASMLPHRSACDLYLDRRNRIQCVDRLCTLRDNVVLSIYCLAHGAFDRPTQAWRRLVYVHEVVARLS